MDSEDIDDLSEDALRDELKSLVGRYNRLEEENEMLQDNLDGDVQDEFQVSE